MSHENRRLFIDRKLVLYTLEPAWLKSMSQVLHTLRTGTSTNKTWIWPWNMSWLHVYIDCVCVCLSGYIRIGLVFASWAAFDTPALFICFYSIFIALDGKVSVNFFDLQVFLFLLFIRKRMTAYCYNVSAWRDISMTWLNVISNHFLFLL